jgi:hypothetical protein
VAAVYLVSEAEAPSDRERLSRGLRGLVELADPGEIRAHRVEHVRLDGLSTNRASDRERLFAARDRFCSAVAKHQRLSLGGQYQRKLFGRRIAGDQLDGAPIRAQRVLVTRGDP